MVFVNPVLTQLVAWQNTGCSRPFVAPSTSNYSSLSAQAVKLWAWIIVFWTGTAGNCSQQRLSNSSSIDECMRYLRFLVLAAAILALPVEAMVITMGNSACMQTTEVSPESSCQTNACGGVYAQCQLPCASCAPATPARTDTNWRHATKTSLAVEWQKPNTLPPHAAGLFRPPDAA